MSDNKTLGKKIIEAAGGTQNIKSITNCATRLRMYIKDVSKYDEESIKKIDGVNDAVVSFMTQKMTVDADDARFDEIMDEVVRVCAKVEPDCQILLQEMSV